MARLSPCPAGRPSSLGATGRHSSSAVLPLLCLCLLGWATPMLIGASASQTTHTQIDADAHATGDRSTAVGAEVPFASGRGSAPEIRLAERPTAAGEDQGTLSLEEAEHILDTMSIDQLMEHTQRLEAAEPQYQQQQQGKANFTLGPDPVYIDFPPWNPPDWHTNNRSEGMCSMYGTCWGDPLNRVINCPANVPAVLPTTFNTTICPRFLGQPVCCDFDQYTALASRVAQAAAVFDRCPACYQSFLEFFCELTCSPNQANFLTVADVTVVNATVASNGTIVDEVYAVNSTVYHLSHEYASRFFNSCRDVKSAATGNPVMQVFFDASDYYEFLTFLGEPGITQDKSPILIAYNYTAENATQTMNLVRYMKDCNDSDTTFTCSCNDCRWCNGPQCVPHYVQPESQLSLGGSSLDPLNAGLILGAVTYLAALLAIWAIRASKRSVPPSLLNVPRRVAQSIRCGRAVARPFLVVSGLVALLFLVGLSWVLFWGEQEIPTADERAGRVHFLDSFWTLWLLILVGFVGACLIVALLVASCFTSALGSFRFSAYSNKHHHQHHQAHQHGPVAGAGSIGDRLSASFSGQPIVETLSASSSASSTSSSTIARAPGGGTDYTQRRVSDVTTTTAHGHTGDDSSEEDDYDDDLEEIGLFQPGGVGGDASRRPRKLAPSDRFFTFLGHLVSTYPWAVILCAVVVTGLCAIGIKNVSLETDPIKLWVSADSEVFQDKERFDATFGAFYRTEQIIWILDTSGPNYNASGPYAPDGGGKSNVGAPVRLLGNGSVSPSLTLLDPSILRVVYAMEQRIQSLSTVYENETVTWDTLCNRPTNQGCIRMSITGYFDNAIEEYQFQNASTTIDTVRAWVQLCVNEPVFNNCRSDIGVPMFPKVIFGGFDFAAEDYTNATALITTWLLNNEPDDLDRALAWEQVYLDEVRRIQHDLVALGIPLTIHYTAERSIQDELARSSSGDIPTIAISYGVMFFYISLALGRIWPLDRRWCVRTKCTLGLAAILLVMFSLAIAVGLVCSMGVKMTPLISEVIPFLVLAIGIDNVFILLHTFERQDRKKYRSVRTRMKRTLREVGTSITLASLSEAVAFILGGQTKMPAVRAFAFYSCAAILADYCLQITAFAAIIVLDARRTEQGRMDCCPCIRISGGTDAEGSGGYGGAGGGFHASGVPGGPVGYSKRLLKESMREGEEQEEAYHYEQREAALAEEEESKAQEGRSTTTTTTTTTKFAASPLLKSASAAPIQSSSLLRKQVPAGPQPGGEDDLEMSIATRRQRAQEGCLQRLMREYYVPFLLHRVTKMCVLILFVLTTLFLLGYGIHNEELGLDHKYVVPTDSYLQAYFLDLKNVFAVGPPVYFVLQPTSDTDFRYPVNQNRVCSQSGCSSTSVQALIFNQVCDPSAYIAQGPSSWLDDYITWLKIRAPCCRTWKVHYGTAYKKGDWCPPQFSDELCEFCLQPSDFVTYNNVTRPPPGAFEQYLEMYLLKSACSPACGSCGWGHNADVIWNADTNRTGATRYMAYHSPLRSEQEFIDALKSGRRINQEIIDSQGLNAYVYSVVYPFFEQYLYIVSTCLLNTGLGLIGIFLLSLVLIRNLWASLQIVLTICMILGDLIGAMAMWGITLNAISVLNFVMAIGISVEFCIHLTVAFMRTAGPRDYRVGCALVTVGSSIISGITLTKFSGVVVLATASSAVFEIFYFRMYLLEVLLATAHGLVFLPVLLSLVGPPSLAKSAVRRRARGKHDRWKGFFQAVDQEGIDDDEWIQPKQQPSDQPEGISELSMQPASDLHDATDREGHTDFPAPNAPDSPDPEAGTRTILHSSASFQAHAPFRP